ncbi:TspO/MBR family protein [Ruficoccus sp. ZRK36]|uniref:TspO/MBR family protein n=1 Tax=Ruficoccus sp. ZRK36 TaxID=2866311 RepID=UPI001C73C12F|nr:TspO/MBR family protein [Ruficoccus sp. ZRK36]QYY34920.1 tryptophan-rich sensory protein [Ruficoccus sp. ZRK36]
MKNPITTLAFILLTLGGGLIVGFAFEGATWYNYLNKPSFTPPGWLFAPVWTLLYVCIGIAGARVFTQAIHPGVRMLWAALLVLNFLWTPVFFGLHWMGAALVIAGLMTAGIVLFIALCWRRDRVAAWLFVPYALWNGFATVLNASIVHLN